MLTKKTFNYSLRSSEVSLPIVFKLKIIPIFQYLLYTVERNRKRVVGLASE